MNDPALPWILAGFAAIVAILFILIWRSAKSKVEALLLAQAEMTRSMEGLEKKFADRKEALAEKNGEIEELRKKLGKTKKRVASVHKSKESEGNRVSHLEEELATLKESYAAAKEELERLRDLSQSSSTSGGPRSKAKKADLSEPAPAAQERSARAERPVSDEERVRFEQRLGTAETQVTELRGALAETKTELRKLKGRGETNRRVYLVTKGELELYKDRFHALERKLGATGFNGLLRAAIAELGETREPSKGSLRPSGIDANESASAYLGADPENETDDDSVRDVEDLARDQSGAEA